MSSTATYGFEQSAAPVSMHVTSQRCTTTACCRHRMRVVLDHNSTFPYQSERLNILASLQTIYEMFSQEVRPKSPALNALQAWIRSRNDARNIVEGRSTTIPGEPDEALNAEVQRLLQENQDLQEEFELEHEDHESETAAVEQDNVKSRPSSRFHIVQADLDDPGLVDELHACPSIESAVHKPGARLLAVRLNCDVGTDDENSFDSFRGMVLGLDVCDCEEDLGELLKRNELWMFLFGCGSGYVTDECLILSPYARSKIALTAAAATTLIEVVERLAKEGAVRTEVDGIRVWRTPEPDLTHETELRQQDETCQLQKACGSEMRDRESGITAAEQDEPRLELMTLFDLMQADLWYPGIVDKLRACPSIANEVNRPGARLLLVRQHCGEQPVDQYWLELILGVSVAVDFIVCDRKEDLGPLLSIYDLFLFGCGSGYVTDECLILSPYARSKTSLTAAAAGVLKNDIERLARERAVRTEVDGKFVWRTPN